MLFANLSWIETVYLISSIYMIGVIWLIQLIHYPSFLYIDQSQFILFHQKHTIMMTILVGPVMLFELCTSVYLSQSLQSVWLIQAGLVTLLFGLTFLVSVPIHNELAKKHNRKLIRKLILTNWPRTILWTLKFLIFYITCNYKVI